MSPFLPSSVFTRVAVDASVSLGPFIRMLIHSLFYARWIGCLTCLIGTNPCIDFREFESEESSNAMGRQTHLLYPTVNGVLVNVEMCRHILDPDPAFFRGHLIPLRQPSVRCLREPTIPDECIHRGVDHIKDEMQNCRRQIGWRYSLKRITTAVSEIVQKRPMWCGCTTGQGHLKNGAMLQRRLPAGESSPPSQCSCRRVNVQHDALLQCILGCFCIFLHV
jgi:hypothetical protein